MIVIKSIEELAATVRRVAREQKSYRQETISDLHEAAAVLEILAERDKKAKAASEAAQTFLEEIP